MAWQLKTSEEDIPESYGQQAKRVGISTGLKALKGIESLRNTFLPPVSQEEAKQLQSTLSGITGKTSGKINDNQQPLSGHIEKQFNIEPEYLEPKNTVENFIQRFGSSAPYALAGGGLGSLGLSAIGSAAAAGAGKLGAPEGVQDIVQLGSEIGTGLAAPKLKEIGGNIGKFADKLKPVQTLSQAKTLEYNLMPKIPKSVRNSAEEILKPFREVESLLETETSRKISKEIHHALGTISKNITKGEINPSTAFNLRKSLNKFSKELPVDKATQYIEPLRKGINKFFDVHAATHPEFYKHLKAGDKLNTLNSMKLWLPQGIEMLDLHKIPAGRAAEKILSAIVGEGERFSRGLLTNNEARKYYFNTITAIANNEPSALIKNANNLLEFLPKDTKEEITNSDWVLS